MAQKTMTPPKALAKMIDTGVVMRVGDDGRLKVGHSSGDGLTEAERQLISRFKRDIITLLGDDATGNEFARTLRFITAKLNGLPVALADTPEMKALDRVIVDHFNTAQDRYEAGDNYGARQHLRYAAVECVRYVRRIAAPVEQTTPVEAQEALI